MHPNFEAMRVAVYGRIVSPSSHTNLAKLSLLIAREGMFPLFHRNLQEALQPLSLAPSSYGWYTDAADLKGCEIMICLGGDGTMLETVNLVRDSGLPVLGVNTGRLGFLANVALSQMEEAIIAVGARKFHADPRALIKVDCAGIQEGGFNYALNEVTIHKKDSASMISMHVDVGGCFMNTYWADGLIVCTPTGSTAYSLSCGGPIVMPGSENFTFTPIAPHNLNVRPVVVSSTQKIVVRPEAREGNVLLTLDSRSFSIDNQAVIRIERAPFDFNLVALEGSDFFSTIRNKLMWGIDRRN